MNDTGPTYAEIAEFEQKRAAIKSHYTTRLKALSAADPEYGRLWNERIQALQDLADAYRIPAAADGQTSDH